MVKCLPRRGLPMLVAAFTAAALIMITAGGVGHSPWLLARNAGAANSAADSLSAAADLPNVAIELADGTRTSFAATAGHVRIATMFYSHCPGVCPMTIDTLRGIERQLTAAQRNAVGFILLSLDPARDSPEALRAMAAERTLTSPRWLLGRTSAKDARAFAAAAHIQYRPLSDDSIDHSTALVLLDARGHVLARASGAGDSPEFVAAVRRAADGH